MHDEAIAEIVNQTGTPVYIYDGQKIEQQYHTLKATLPPDFEILYSMKANPLLGICEKLRSMGSGIEVASAGELCTALKAGVMPSDIVFTSPGKTCEELEYAIQAGIYCINIESVQEAERIDAIASRNGKKADIAIRINPGFDVSGAKMKMTGVPTQFGIDQSQLEASVKELCRLQNVNIIGLHIYSGTQILNWENIVGNMQEIFKLAMTFSSSFHIPLKFLDLGGGFGIPYFRNETALDTDKLKAGIHQLWEEVRESFKNTRVVAESGRFLLAESGCYVTKILYRKQCRGRTYLVCDGGSSQHANAAFLGRFVRNNFPMHILNANGSEEEVYVSGPLCTPTDILGQGVMLPRADVGDYVVVEKSGAYGLTNSPVFFLSHPLPLEIMYDKGENYILRERGTAEAPLRGQKSLGGEKY